MKGSGFAQNKGISGRRGQRLIKGRAGLIDFVLAGKHNAPTHQRESVFA